MTSTANKNITNTEQANRKQADRQRIGPTRKKRKWTKKDEEIIEFFMDLIPIMQEVKKDLESKNLLGKEFLQQDDSQTNRET